MNFLSRTTAALAVFALVGCGASFEPSDASRDIHFTDAFADTIATPDGPPSDSPTSANCLGDADLTAGSGQVRASVQIDTRLMIARSDVWVAAMCLDAPSGEQATRVVGLDPGGGDTSLAGLAPGRYAIRTSTLTVPSVRSNEVIVTAGSVAATLLSLAQGPAPIAIARTPLNPTGMAPDGGVMFVDAASGDGGGAVARLEVPIIDTATGRDPVGSLAVELLTRDASSFDLVVHVRASCSACAVSMNLASVEARLSRARLPYGLAVGRFTRPTLTPGLSTSVDQPMTLPGRIGDPDLELTLLLFGTIAPMR